MSGETQAVVLDGLAPFIARGSDLGAEGIRIGDRLRDDLAVDSLKLLMVISYLAEQMDLDLADFAEVDLHGIDTVADLIGIFETAVQTAGS